MLTIARLKARHWKCFETIDLELHPANYAIVARRTTDPESSNWAGKSSLLEAVDFVLWGRLAKAVRGKSGWITHEEKSGEVELELSDGSRIIRSKAARGPEKIWYFRKGIAQLEKAACGDEAEKEIGALVGLTKDDFVATCYFQQRQMARLVTCEPSTRMDLIAGWIRLGPLQECEDVASSVLADLITRRDAAVAAERLALAGIDNGFDHFVGANNEVDFELELQSAAAVLADAEGRLALAQAAREREIESVEIASKGRRYEAIVEEGRELAQQLARAPAIQAVEHELEGIKVQLRTLSEELGVAERDTAALQRVAQGRFDGVCPIVGQTCPSREFVVMTANRDRAVGAERAAVSARLRGQYEDLGRRQSVLTEQRRAIERTNNRIRDLRVDARALKPAHERWKAQEGERVEVAVGPIVQEVADARARLQNLQAVQARNAAKRKEAAAFRQTIESLEGPIETAREAVAIFGKNGAQRRAAEGALGDIEGLANAALGRAAIDLTVQMVWSREGSGLAAACPQCGSAFPASARVKVCGRCGTERGANLVNRLEIDLSDRSGGAEDLAGACVQLAGSRWLREDRESRWATALVDEPFGQLDGPNRRAFAGKFPAMLRESRFAQSFVIAHHAGVLDAMPGRIEIVSDGRRSTARVVA